MGPDRVCISQSGPSVGRAGAARREDRSTPRSPECQGCHHFLRLRLPSCLGKGREPWNLHRGGDQKIGDKSTPRAEWKTKDWETAFLGYGGNL